MATKIKLRNGAKPASERLVRESAKDASFEINQALSGGLQFVVLTDAGTGKEFSLQPERVISIESE